jgi:hypothetical protein
MSIYKTLRHCTKDMSMYINIPPQVVIQEDPHLQQLVHKWVKCNKERVFPHQCTPPSVSDTVKQPFDTCQSHHIARQPRHVAQNHKSVKICKQQRPSGTFESMYDVHRQISPHVLASFQQVVSSRKDLPYKTVKDIPCTIVVAPHSPVDSHVIRPSDTHTAEGLKDTTKSIEMAGIEKDILQTLCNKFLQTESSYSVYAVSTTQKSVASNDTTSNDIIAHACYAHISTVGSDMIRQMYLPIVTPSRDQIAKCAIDVCYNKNVQLNVARLLSAHNVKIQHNTDSGSKDPNTVYIDTDTPIQTLGTTICCENLLFGKCRTTSSNNFSLGGGLSKVYAAAVHKYQQYNNVSVGEHITLVPSFHKRTPMVVSLSCPQLNISQVTTYMSTERNHTKLGPNHTTQAVEVTSKMAPFVKLCLETYMKLPLDTIEDLREDNNIPIAHCVAVEHCFAYDALHGLSAYVATHMFSLPTEILNTYVLSSDVVFPPRKEITVYVAVLFGGVATGRMCTHGEHEILNTP